MKLEYLCTFRAELGDTARLGATPVGERLIADISGGTFEGPRMRGTLKHSGADWAVVGPDGVARLDVRATFETDDGALIYVQYHGLLEMNEAVGAALAKGGDTQIGDAYFFSQPRFETSDERYAWLNKIVTVGEGRFAGGAVEYKVYEAQHE